jgi:hypothetical protein
MSARKTLASCGIPARLQDRLTAAQYVFVDDLRGVNPVDLAQDLQVTNSEALDIMKAACKPQTSILSRGATVLDTSKVRSAARRAAREHVLTLYSRRSGRESPRGAGQSTKSWAAAWLSAR